MRYFAAVLNLEIFANIQKSICNFIGPDLESRLHSLFHHSNSASLYDCYGNNFMVIILMPAIVGARRIFSPSPGVRAWASHILLNSLEN